MVDAAAWVAGRDSGLVGRHDRRKRDRVGRFRHRAGRGGDRQGGFFGLPDLGYILHPEHWGLGLASEAVGAAVAQVFTTREVDDLTADVDPANQASTRLLEKLGFVRTGFAEKTWNIGGEWKDSLFYGLTRQAWIARLEGSSARP
ncbi:GNAT family protein [Brevundimonas sp. NIBR11]|uniref:GNAT family N-acetyltransferase n=1 Tax=Brevundimonas sp. NIBR11 TaxID=3015999 RepID=UPI0022F0905A|nr:GNAT family protein [Brevundimonas sp. NIBR11]